MLGLETGSKTCR
uniref:Uncharacterized protein n=1 Tax=Anguilla anguilla TaxID=7936 RepID=A0A0E9S984_ANGAN